MEALLSPEAVELRLAIRRPPQSTVMERGMKPGGILFCVLLVLQFLEPVWFPRVESMAWALFAGVLCALLYCNKVAQADLSAEYQHYLAQFSAEQLEIAWKQSDQVYDSRFIDAVVQHLKARQQQAIFGP